MARKRAMVILFATAIAVAVAIIPSAAMAASTQARPANAAGSARAAAASLACGVELDWCIWTGANGTGNELVSGLSISNLGIAGFRNVDGSLGVEAGGGVPYLVRFFYSPNYAGAWVCLDAGTYLANTANYQFNNGGGLAGYGQNIYHNIASVQVSGGSCSNPTR
jgi:hypothetical protein